MTLPLADVLPRDAHPRHKGERWIDRVEDARALLAIHGFISDVENRKCRHRIRVAAEKQGLTQERTDR